MEIEKKLLNDIEMYCKLNEIENPSKFATDLLKKAFNIEKYGERPFISEKPQVSVIEEKKAEIVVPTSVVTQPKLPKKEIVVVSETPKPKRGRPKREKEVVEVIEPQVIAKPKKRKLS